MLATLVSLPALLVGLGGAPVSHGLASFSPTRCVLLRMEAALDLTPTLIEWGCDDDLWSEVRNKQALLDLAASGNEKKARERIEFLRGAIARGDGASPAAPKKAPPNGPYTLVGPPPEGVEIETVEAMLAERAEAKKSREFATADALQADLMAMGVNIDDKRRNWEAAKPASGGFTLTGVPPEGFDVAAAEALLARRREAKKAREFDVADAMQIELSAMGVWVDDRKRVWSVRTPPSARRAAGSYKLKGAPPPGVEVEAVEGLLARRNEAKRCKDFETADELQKQLMDMGVYVSDRSRTWEEARWVREKAGRVEAASASPPTPEAPTAELDVEADEVEESADA